MRKLMIAVTAVAGLTMVTGCKKDDVQAQREDVAEARQEAAQETAEARQDESQELASAQENANEDVAEARQDANDKIASANEEVRDEEQDLAEAQANRNEDLAEGGSGMAGTTSAAAATTVNGRVLSKSGDTLTLVDSSNKELKIKTNDKTALMDNGSRAVKLDDIQEGSQVRASYVMDGKDMVARDVTLVAPVKKLDK
ncbi:putative lipoprotein [Corallococcus coralloides DSM 2259]|uniref:Putative lipoprotein n=2 Tax=Corallococcus coralloides TaxID=184914 RepID=H8N0D5_CORCM|nr:putative lipoprotein [Corallococcus coralloides DSM 2259]